LLPVAVQVYGAPGGNRPTQHALIAQLSEMGFDAATATAALQRFGNFEMALGYLLSGAGAGGPLAPGASGPRAGAAQAPAAAGAGGAETSGRAAASSAAAGQPGSAEGPAAQAEAAAEEPAAEGSEREMFDANDGSTEDAVRSKMGDLCVMQGWRCD